MNETSENVVKARVLCIDDEALYREMMTDYLEDSGFAVKTPSPAPP